MCKENNIQPKAGLLIKDSENPSIDFTNQFLKSGPAVKAVAEAVKRYVFPVLAVVFRNNGLQPTQSITIMKSFEHMSNSLKTLNFSKNNLGAQGGIHLSSMLCNMKNLKELYLEDSMLGDKGVKHVIEKLDHNNLALEILDLSGNLIG